MCISTPATGTPTVTPPLIPSHVWCDLSQHLGQARAVANVCREELPVTYHGHADMAQVNQLVDLIYAVGSLLELAETDCQKLEALLP